VQTLPAIARIPVIKSSQRGALAKDMLEVAEQDYLYVLRGIALQEIDAQVRIGNKPSALLVDGRRGEIRTATESIAVWFANRTSLAEAIIAARDAVIANGRRVTGRTLGFLAFAYSVGPNGAIQPGDPKAVAASTPNPAALDLYVTQPVVHVRRWQWLTATGERGKRRSRDKKRGLMHIGGGKFVPRMVSESVFERAAQQVQARYPALDVEYIYLQSRNLNPNGWTAVDRIPAIKVRMTLRGRRR
jgi:hypothetical protein